MECEVCKERSSVGYCAESNVLICEVCSSACEKCGTLIRTDAARMSERSGRIYCTHCWNEKHPPKPAKASKAPVAPTGGAAVDTSFAALGDAADASVSDVSALNAVEDANEAIDEEAALKASAWKPPPPWKLSFQSAIIGLVAILCVYIFPSFYRVTMPGGQVILTPYFLMVVPIIAIIWGALGLTSMDYMADKTRSLLGVLIGGAALVLCIAALMGDPHAAADNLQIETRDGYSRQELAIWREKMLEKHRP